MNKIIAISSGIALSLSLISCNTLNNSSQFLNSTVGSGIKLGATTIGTGVGVLTNTGAYVGHGVGRVVGTGVGVVTGQPASYHRIHTKNGMVYHNGHYYKLHNGRYILVR